MRLIDANENDAELMALVRGLYAADVHSLLAEVKDTSHPALNTSFIEICDFYEKQGRLPVDSDEVPIYEMMLAAKLKEILGNDTRRFSLNKLDTHGLLKPLAQPEAIDASGEIPEDIAAAMGSFETIDDIMSSDIFSGLFDDVATEDLFDTSFVDNHRRKSAADIGSRIECINFETEFKPLFDSMKEKITDKAIRQIRVADDGIHQNEVKKGAWFIINEQMMYIADISEDVHRREHGRIERRVRVIIDNGQESNILMRSVTKMAHADPKAVKLR